MAEETFDRMIGALHGLPDVVAVKPTTIRAVIPLVGKSQTFIVQTYRQREAGDTIFIEHVGEGGIAIRLALPPSVAETIARQRDALTARSRSRAAKTLAEERKAAGVVPGFMRNPGKGRKRKA